MSEGTAPGQSLGEAVREAVDACIRADRPDLLERLLAGMLEILMQPRPRRGRGRAEKS